MPDFDRHLVVDLPFNSALSILVKTLADRGFLIIAATNLDAALARLGRAALRRYAIVSALHVATAERVLKWDLDAGAWLTSPFVVYELPDGETVVAVAEPLGLVARSCHWDSARPELAQAAVALAAELAYVFDEIQRRARAGSLTGLPTPTARRDAPASAS